MLTISCFVRCNFLHTGMRNGPLPFLCWPRNRASASSKVTVAGNGKHHLSTSSPFFSFPMLSPALLFSPAFSFLWPFHLLSHLPFHASHPNLYLILSVLSVLAWSRLSSVQVFSHIRLFATSWTAARQASLSITNSQILLKLMSIESVVPSNCLILCCPFSSSLQSFPASGSPQMSQLFESGGQSTRVSASASILPMNIQD